MSYIIEKTSKIASVSLLLSDVLDGSTILKDELQRTAMSLVNDTALSAQSLKKREQVIGDLLTLLTLLGTVERSGHLSKMNTDTLSNEVTSLIDFIHAIDWNNGRRFADSSFFGGDVPRDVFAPEPMVSGSMPYNSHVKDNVQRQSAPVTQRGGVYSSETSVVQQPKQLPQYKERVQEVQKDRRATILGIVQKKDRITVKDVTNVIKDCSDKTIQRELLALVKQGVLKKEGERRWSTYSLA